MIHGRPNRNQGGQLFVKTQVVLEFHREGELRPALILRRLRPGVEVTPSGPERELVIEPELDARSPDPLPCALSTT